MSSWKVHLIFNSLFLFVWVRFLLNYGFINDYVLLVFLIFFNIFLTIFPDVDSSKSKIRGLFALILTSTATIYLFFNSTLNFDYLLVIFILFYVLFRFFPTKHRGFTHSLWFSILLSLIITTMVWMKFSPSLLNLSIYFFFILSGYLSHIFLDKIY
jgi:hypothetical protein